MKLGAVEEWTIVNTHEHDDHVFHIHTNPFQGLGAKSQGECGINPVAPAVSNALADATGVRFAHLPFTPDRLFAKLAESG